MVSKKKITRKTSPKVQIEGNTASEPPTGIKIIMTDKPKVVTNAPKLVHTPLNQINQIKAWFKEAPIAEVVPTQRWYGEQFHPAYVAWIEKGKKILG